MSEFVNPTQILQNLNLKKAMVAADFGCGSGGWVIPLAKILEDGMVFAVDVQTEPLSALAGKTKSEGLSNIKQIVADVEAGVPAIKDLSCDLVLLTNLLFQVEDKPAVLKEASRLLKQSAQLLIVDWQEETALGPKQGACSKEQATSFAIMSGFKLDKELDTGGHHYGLLFLKA